MRKNNLLYLFIKRLCDIVFSFTGVLITSPLWLISVIGIIISDPGPVFYLANRVGKGNKQFRMFKFRSMRVDKNADEKSLRPDQDRIFRFGQFLRATKIDELPQLLNVLFGNMSVVGPRPAANDQVSVTRSGENAIVSTIKPGLTSPSALYDYIYGDKVLDEAEYIEKVVPTRLALDRYYITRQNLFYDIKIIWYTILCIFGTVFRKPAVFILREMIDAVDGDRRALDDDCFA
ncbi:MAG: sugar transferase [Ruminococcus sp.]|nr:sugar transferase [Ruminococcus sp.]